MRTALLLSAALAGTQAAAQIPQSIPDPGERICRVQGQVGSRLGARRVCKTRAEWEDLDRSSRNAVRDVQMRHVSPTVDQYPGMANGMPGTPR